MFLVYFDETGDPGSRIGTTPYFIVTALIINEENWRDLFQELKSLRKLLRNEHDIPLNVELKGHHIINAKKKFRRVNNSKLGKFTKPERLEILRKIVSFLSELNPLLDVQNVCYEKSKLPMDKKERKQLAEARFTRTWEFTLQRIETHLFYFEKNRKDFVKNENAVSLPNWLKIKAAIENALLFPDQTQNDRLRKLCRRMHVYNYVPYRSKLGEKLSSRHMPIEHILGDPAFIDSQYLIFVQIADIIGYCLAKHLFPETVPVKYKSVRIYKSCGLSDLFPILEPILCKRAAPSHPLGIKILED